MRSTLLLSSLALLCLTGCFKPIQVTVPDNFHGEVTIRCVATGRATRQITADSNGNAEAECPAVQPTIQVIRAGQPVTITGEPVWQQTKDGEMKAVQLQIQ